MQRLVDLSRAQSGHIDWARVRAAGYSGAIVQLTQGGSEQAERVAYAHGRIRELAAEGLPAWVSHYAQAFCAAAVAPSGTWMQMLVTKVGM